MKNQRRGGVVLSYLNIALNMIFNLILIPMLICALSEDDYSLYKVMQAFAGPLMMFNLGMSTVVARCVAQYRVHQTEEELKKKENTFAIAVLISFGMAVLVAIIGRIMVTFLPALLEETYTPHQIDKAGKLLHIFVGTTAVHIMNDAFRGCIQGRERFYFLYGSTTIRYILRFVMIVSLIRFTSADVLLIAAVDLVLYVLLLLASFLYSFFGLKEKFYLYFIDKQELKLVLSFSFAVLLHIIVNQVNNNLDTIILGSMIADKQVVIMYSSALSIFAMFSSLISVFVTVYLPEATQLVAKDASGKELTNFVIRPGRIQATIALAILCAFGLFGDMFIELWIGAKYRNAYYVALILMAVATIPHVQNVCYAILDAKLKRMFSSVTLVFMAILNIIVSIILVRKINYWGALIGTALSLIIGDIIIMNLYYSRVIGLEIIYMFRKIFKGIFPAAIISTAICIPVRILLPMHWTAFIFGCIIFVLMYLGCLWRFGWSEEEKIYFRETLHRT